MLRAVNRSQRAGTLPIPAPVGGLNAREALAAMSPADASVLTNMFPDTASVDTRKGHEAFADGTSLFGDGLILLTRGFQTVAVWSAGASSKLFAVLPFSTIASSNWGFEIYEVATNGTLASSHSIAGNTTAVGRPNCGEWTMFVTGSTTGYLVMRFGDGTADFTRAYDGSAWSTPSITGLPATGVYGITSHRHRLWFYGKDLTAYYLPTSAISGAVASFNFGLALPKGGRIVSMRTWTLDGGEGGTDDLLLVLTDKGQVAIYSGTDPSSPATWALVGVFDVGAPASAPAILIGGTSADAIRGGAFMMKYGADVLMMLADGVMSAARILRPAEGMQDYSISGKINALLRDAAATYGANGTTIAGMWSIVHHPRLKQVLVNIPTAVAAEAADGRCTSIQYVMNTETGAWTKFEDMGYLDAVVWRGDLYFVSGGYYVYRYGTVNADLGAAITFEARQAYNYLNSPNNKLVTLMQPMLRTTGNFSLTVEADADFNGGTISAYTSYTVSGTTNLQPMLSPAKYGRAIATHLKGQTSAGVVSWYATNYLTQGAGGF